jgi:hypothetical protein
MGLQSTMKNFLFSFLLLSVSSLSAQTSFQEPGISYLKSKFPCALNDFGSKGKDNACVRLTLFDGNSKVAVNIETGSIELQNVESYKDETLIFDLLVPGSCNTKEGKKRINIHYKIEKKDKNLSAQIHTHFTSKSKCKTADMENYEIKLVEGKKTSTLISKDDSAKSVLDPSTMSKFLKELVEVEDNLDTAKNDSKSTSGDLKTIGDITISVGKSKVSKKIANCKFIITNNKNKPVKDLLSVLNESDWEIQLNSLSSLFPKQVLITELFLIGVNDKKLTAYIEANGLPKNKNIIFKKTGSTGKLIYPEGEIEMADYKDVVKSFFTGTFTGSIFLEKLEAGIK